MALLNIVYYPDDPLRKKAVSVETIDSSIKDLANDMLETMEQFEGVGLAAPQVGLSWRMFVYCPPEGEPHCIVNPQLELSGPVATGEEGCLSLPEVYAQVPRRKAVHVRGFDERGHALDFVAEDFVARIIQHEYDHLDGIVFPDRLDLLSREDKLREFADTRRHWNEAVRA
jgi:peptide deformylase